MTIDHTRLVLSEIAADNKYDKQPLDSSQRRCVANMIEMPSCLSIETLSKIFPCDSKDLFDLG